MSLNSPRFLGFSVSFREYVVSVEEQKMDNSEATSANIEESSTVGKTDKASKGRRGPRPRQWKDLSSRQRTRIMIPGGIQVALMIWTLWDLAHRPADRIKGKKRLWVMAAFVQPFGPIAYMLFGRKR